MNYLMIINDAINKSSFTKEFIAKKIGISPSHFCSFRNGTYNLGMYHYIKLLKMFFDTNTVNNMIMEYIKMDPTPDKYKSAMEYSLFLEYYDLLKLVIDHFNKSTKQNSQIKEWVKFYSLFISGKTNEEIYMETKNISAKTKEMALFKDIIEIKYLYFSKHYLTLDEKIKLAQKKLEDINDKMIKDFYGVRLGMLSGYVNFYLNNTDDSIRDLTLISKIDLDDQKLAHIYHALGLNYFKRDVEISFSYLAKSREIFNNNKNEKEVNNVQNSINFIACYSENLHFYVDIESKNVDNIHNRIFKAIRENKVDEAKFMIENIDLEKINDNNKGFLYYLKGLLYESVDCFLTSAIYFQKCGDKIYLTLPCDELIRLGMDKNIVNGLYGDFIY